MHTWSQLGSWRPDLATLQDVSRKIYKTYTTAARAEAALQVKDCYLAHDIYFMRDALQFCTFERAVSFGDPGVILRVLKYWAFGFRGAGQHNYARECAEILVHFKYETSDAMRAALKHAWFVNEFGLPGRFKASDLYLEHLNFWVKVSIILSDVSMLGC